MLGVIRFMRVMHVIRVMRSNPSPSIIVISVMRDIYVMHVKHVMSPTLLLE